MATRNTIQRQVVLSAVKDLKNHPTSEEVYSYIKPKFPSISLGTVYRNLNMLSETNEIRKISANDNAVRFDFMLEDHHHFQCKECGCLLDVFMEYDHTINDSLEKKHNFKIDSCDVLLSGVCKDCLFKAVTC